MTYSPDSKSVYTLLLIYGASTATTTLACVAVILAAPQATVDTIASNIAAVTPEQRTLLLSSYVPFLIIPFVMTVDMGIRVSRLVHAGLKAQGTKKSH